MLNLLFQIKRKTEKEARGFSVKIIVLLLPVATEQVADALVAHVSAAPSWRHAAWPLQRWRIRGPRRVPAPSSSPTCSPASALSASLAPEPEPAAARLRRRRRLGAPRVDRRAPHLLRVVLYLLHRIALAGKLGVEQIVLARARPSAARRPHPRRNPATVVVSSRSD